jgi:hypothetical protein
MRVPDRRTFVLSRGLFLATKNSVSEVHENVFANVRLSSINEEATRRESHVKCFINVRVEDFLVAREQ